MRQTAGENGAFIYQFTYDEDGRFVILYVNPAFDPDSVVSGYDTTGL